MKSIYVKRRRTCQVCVVCSVYSVYSVYMYMRERGNQLHRLIRYNSVDACSSPSI